MIDQIENTAKQVTTKVTELERFIEDNGIPLEPLSSTTTSLDVSYPSSSPSKQATPSSPKGMAYSIYINNTQPSTKAEEEASTVLFHSKIKKWVNDDLVEKCHSCQKQFSFLFRKHHCRSCGHIYCYNCASNYISLPTNLLTLEEPNSLPKLASFEDLTKFPTTQTTQTTQTQRVCNKCKDKVQLMRKVWSKIKLIKNSELTIIDIQLIKSTTTDKEWKEAALYFIAQFRSLLYQFTKDKPTDEEYELLKKNARLFYNHSCWTAAYFKSIPWETLDLETQKEIIKTTKTPKNHSQYPCSKLFCNTRCKPILTLEDVIELLSETNSNPLREHLIKQLPQPPLSPITEEELTCYLPLLIDLLDRDWNNLLSNYLINTATTQASLPPSQTENKQPISFKYDLLRYLRHKVQTTHPQYQPILNRYQRAILTSDPTSLKNIINTEQFINLINSTPNTTDINRIQNHFAASTIFQNYEISQHHSDKEWLSIKNRTKKDYHLPTDPTYFIKNVDCQSISIKSSATKPILIPCICTKPKTKPRTKQQPQKHNRTNRYPPPTKTKHILFKREDLTKDYIIMNIISLMDIFLKRDENIDFNITKYRIIPTSKDAGIIEIVQNAETFYNIKEKLNYTIQNYMIEKNKSTTTETLRRRFATSTAAYCVITYLLGIGDRHLDNIMMAENGSLFHIDYSFILGSDPKMLEPHMRITEDMIDALGGLESSDYKHFKDLCFRAYNCLRRHYNIFTQLLLLLPNQSPTHIKREVFKRFIPCEKRITAELQLEKSLETHSRSYKYNLIDFVYRHKKEQTLQTGLMGLITSPYTLLTWAKSSLITAQ